MARQRFIWPTIWSDSAFGTLKPEEQVLFIGLYSLADDEGRISADPAFLRAQIFTYKNYTNKKVEGIRNRVVERMANVCLYRFGDQNEEAIALLKWSEYQKPKYPKPSRIPPPLPEDSRNVPESFPPRVGLGREGLGLSQKQEPPPQPEARPPAREPFDLTRTDGPHALEPVAAIAARTITAAHAPEEADDDIPF